MPRKFVATDTSRIAAQDQNAVSDEVAQVLLALHELEKRVSSPIIRVCLEEVRWDIAHLANGSVEEERGRFALACTA
jgi:hypothetical protein